MNLDHLEDFLELARELNFSRAAANRNMTQPAFSRRIASLESSLQASLITRTTRRVSLTPAGHALRAHAETVVRMMVAMRQDVLEAAGRARKSLKIASTHALSYTFVPRWLMQVAGPSEIGALNMVSDTQRQCLRMIRTGTTDFFVTHSSLMAPLPLSERHFRFQPIGEDRLVPLCAPASGGHPRWRLGETAGVPLISYGEASGLYTILEDHWSLHGRPHMIPKMSSVLASTNLEMAKEGQGVAFLPLSLAEQELARETLVRAGGPEFEIPVRVLIFRPRARLSAHCESFWRNVVERGAG